MEFPQYSFVGNYYYVPAQKQPTLVIIQGNARRIKRILMRLLKEDQRCRKFLKQLTKRYNHLISYENASFLQQKGNELFYTHELPKNNTSADIKRLEKSLTTTETQQSHLLTTRYLLFYFNIDAIHLIHNPEDLTLNFGLQIKYLMPPKFREVIFDSKAGKRKIKNIEIQREKPIIGSGLFMAAFNSLTIRGQEIL